MWTIIYQKADLLRDGLIATGTHTDDIRLDELAADQVGKGCCQNNAQRPPPAFYTEIGCREQQQKEIERHPEQGFTHIWQHGIQHGIAPILVNMGKQPCIKWLDLLPKC